MYQRERAGEVAVALTKVGGGGRGGQVNGHNLCQELIL